MPLVAFALPYQELEMVFVLLTAVARKRGLNSQCSSSITNLSIEVRVGYGDSGARFVDLTHGK